MKSKSNSDKYTLAKGRVDMIAWLAIAFLLTLGIAANHYYRELAWPLRASAGIVVACVLLAIVAQTEKGRKAWGFMGRARNELRKVVWPTRQETVQITVMVVAVVIVMVFILWGVDSFLMQAVSWLTGQ